MKNDRVIQFFKGYTNKKNPARMKKKLFSMAIFTSYGYLKLFFFFTDSIYRGARAPKNKNNILLGLSQRNPVSKTQTSTGGLNPP